MPANISSAFVIQYVPAGAGATTIVNPGRTFRVVGVMVNNPTNGALVCKVTDATPNNITNGGDFSAAADASSRADLDNANVEIGATENLIVTAATGITSVEILCVASGGGQSLVVS